MNVFLARVLPLLPVFFCWSAHGEKAAGMLKVPPVGDRPVAETNSPTNAAKEKKDAPSSPSPTPTGLGKGEEQTNARGPGETAPDSIVPEPFPVSRYASLWENSPFQNESIAPPQQSEGLAQRFVLGGILRENGEPVVWVRERATQQSYKVTRKATNNLGLSLVATSEPVEKQSDATATIRLGGEQGVIKFDTAAAGSVPGVAMPPPMARPAMPTPLRPPQAATSANIPGHPGNVSGNAPAQTVANSAAVPPGVVPPVPGPGVPQNGQVQTPGQEQMPPPRVIRRRAIVPAAPGAP